PKSNKLCVLGVISPFAPSADRIKAPRLLERCDSFFFFNDAATTEIYTLSLHDALPIFTAFVQFPRHSVRLKVRVIWCSAAGVARSEEHTSELQSRGHLVCRLLLEKKKRAKS